MKTLGRFLASFVTAFAVYSLLTSPFRPVLDKQEFLAGAVLALAAGLLTMKKFPLDGKYFNPVRWGHFLVYLPVFFWKMIAANLQIAAVVLNPELPVKPSIIKNKTALSSDAGKLVLTSSVTLTPGTLTVDVRKQDVYIHCVKEEKETVSSFEKFIKGVTE